MDLFEERIHLVPVLRRRLVQVPLGIDQPYWVDDENFDLEYHVRELALPRPGSDAQLAAQVARIHARPLDRARPLWETYLIRGLARKRVAVYTKIHHAAFDGVAGADILTVLADLDPAGRSIPLPARFVPEPAPSGLSVAAATLARLVARPLGAARLAAEAVRVMPALAPGIRPVVDGVGRLTTREGPADGGLLASRSFKPPTTPLNTRISAHRKCSFVTLPLDDVRFVKRTFGVSVNDVVMAVCAGAVRRWLLRRNALPSVPLVAMVPVSLRADSHGGQGNKVSAMLAVLPTNVADPVDRLAQAHEDTQIAKQQHAFIPQGLVDGATDFAPPAFTQRAARVIFGTHILTRLPAFNLVISNVPGPNVPVYLAGAKLLAHYPLSIVSDGMALNITLIGYLGGLHFGLVAAREAVPDVDDLGSWLAEELALLVKAAKSVAPD